MLDYNDERGLKTIKEEYAWFKANEQHLLSLAAKMLNKSKLNFSLQEIDDFGEAIEKAYNEQMLFQEIDMNFLPAIFIAYYGNAFMHYFGGKWYFSTKKVEHGYGSPMLIEYGNQRSWAAIPPYDYYIRVIKGSFGKLSRLIEHKISIYERQSIQLKNPRS
ncbi:MAG: hypothetical protein SFW35_03950 [Chitinophagales bacterium]|nr:hypothetical protein [Chitinophagales bacterium]